MAVIHGHRIKWLCRAKSLLIGTTVLGRFHEMGSKVISFEGSATRVGLKYARHRRAFHIYNRLCIFACTLRSPARKAADQTPWNNVFVEQLSDPGGPDAI